MSFFNQQPESRNIVGESFLGGFQSGLSRAEDEQSVRRRHTLQNQLYQEDYRAAAPALKQLIEEDIPLNQKLIKLQQADLPPTVRQETATLLINQEKAKTQTNFLKTSEAITKEVDKQLGINEILPFDKQTEEQKEKYSDIQRLSHAYAAQGNPPAVAVDLAIKTNKANKERLLKEHQQTIEKQRQELKNNELIYSAEPIEQKVERVLGTDTSKSNKIKVLKNLGLDIKDALAVVEERKTPEEALKSVRKKEMTQSARSLFYEMTKERGRIPREAMTYAARQNQKGKLLEPETIDKLDELGLPKIFLRKLRGVREKASIEERERAYDQKEKSVEKWLEENWLEE